MVAKLLGGHVIFVKTHQQKLTLPAPLLHRENANFVFKVKNVVTPEISYSDEATATMTISLHCFLQSRVVVLDT